MKHVLNVLLLLFISTCIAIGVHGISLFYFDINFFLGGFNAFIAFWLSFIPMGVLYIRRHRKLNASFTYRKKNIKNAARKVRQIQINKFKARSFDKYRKIDRLYKAANQILKVVKEEPARYVAAKKFFSDYLDSAVFITKQYALFLQQPVRSQEVQASLKETEDALDEMTVTFEKELMEILSKDRMTLDLEVEYMRNAMQEKSDKMNVIKDHH